MKVGQIFLGCSLLVVTACGFQDDSALDRDEAYTSVPYVEGNPDCGDYGYAHEVKFEAGEPKTVTVNGNTFTYSFTEGETDIDWTSTIALDMVIVKAGDGAHVYTYDPEATSGSVVTPYNNGGNQAALSHLTLCFDYEVGVEKTASTSFKRDHQWTIQKSAAETAITLSLGQHYLLAFAVTVTSSAVDSNWKVGGTITVTNPDPTFPAIISSVTDNLSGVGAIAVDCGEVTWPVSIPSGGSLVCEYLSNVLPDSSQRVNTATATAADNSEVGGGTDSVDVIFSSYPGDENVSDGCVTVTDTHQGDLGPVCAVDGTKTFEYTVPLHYEVCGPATLTNTASFTSTTSDETGSSTVDVAIDVPCTGGCTLTQGYWKTHSAAGPAPYDDLWAGFAGETLHGMSWYDILWTPPAGNVWYVLAHQWIAATLNVANGASVTAAVQAAMTDAENKLTSTSPASAKSLKGAAKQAWVSLAYTLDQYNNGNIGPGHCSE